MNLAPHYLTYTIYDNGVIGTGDPMSFDDACSQYADFRDDGYDCVVFRMEPGVDGAAGAMIDVSDDADARIRSWLLKRHDDFPAWMVAA